MHPYDIFNAYDKHYGAIFTMLYALRGKKPAEMRVETWFNCFILPKMTRRDLENQHEENNLWATLTGQLYNVDPVPYEAQIANTLTCTTQADVDYAKSIPDESRKYH